MRAMDFTAAINKMMPDVRSRSDEPIIIYRDNEGGWHCDHTNDQNGYMLGKVEEIMKQDPLAVEYMGKDFSNATYPRVYDAVLRDRVRAEYYVARSADENVDEFQALSSFFDDNVGAFSRETTDYLATLEKPLATLSEMCPYKMATKKTCWLYNEDLSADAVYHIEKAALGRLNIVNASIMLNSSHCIKNSNNADYTGQLLIVKADYLVPKRSDAESQIVMCTHGSGARPNAKGRYVYCNELVNKRRNVYYRENIEGIANISKLPKWAKRIIKETQAEQKAKSPEVKASLFGMLEDAKTEAAAYNAGRKEGEKPKRRRDMEVGLRYEI